MTDESFKHPSRPSSVSRSGPSPGKLEEGGGAPLSSIGRTPAELPGGLHLGDLLAGRFVLESVLGAGGMGVVCGARHAQLGQRVAIKFMRGEAMASSSAVDRFLREARAVAALSSEHVAKVLDFGTLESGEPYAVMEYLSGSDLSAVLQRGGPLESSKAVWMVLQACEAIAEAHSLGIVHRDLKPANLFATTQLDGMPFIKVLDFGISKVSTVGSASTSQSLTAAGFLMGSPEYMSPEQVRDAKNVDSRSDIWSIGVILYELIAGTPPFHADTAGEVFARILTQDPPALGSAKLGVPEGLVKVVAQCLERNVSRRVQSVGDLATKLLPFAPPDGKISVQRICRLTSRVAGAHQGSDFGLGAPCDPTISRGAAGVREDTGPAWLRSGASATFRSPIRWRTTLFAGALFAAALTVGASLYVTRSRLPLQYATTLPPSMPAPTASTDVAVRAKPEATLAPVATEEPSEVATRREATEAGMGQRPGVRKGRPHEMTPHPEPAASAPPVPQKPNPHLDVASPAEEPTPGGGNVFEHRQ
ncbi:MAG: protein kinase [Polyangiaceae bacterium]|jgi:serine/threonine-protein kinase